MVKHLLHMNRAAMQENEDHLIRNRNIINPKATTAANLNLSELQITRIDPNSAEEFTEDEVAGNVSLGVACRCMEYLMHERDHEKVQTPKLNRDPKPDNP